MKSGVFCLFENWTNSYKETFTNQMAIVKKADELRFDELWFGEHHFNNFSISPSLGTLLSYAFAITKNIKIGSAGYLLPYYNPIKLTEELATLELLSDGRFMFGIAKGAFPIYDRAINGSAIENREIMFEYNHIIQKLLYEDNVTFEGKYFNCYDISIRPKPFNKIPTFIASQSDEAINEALNYGYGLLGSISLSIEEVENIFLKYNSNIPKNSLNFTLMRAFCVANDEAINEVKEAIEIFIQCMISAKETNPALAKLVQNTPYEKIRSTLFDKNKILDGAIIGTPKECVEQIRELKKRININSLVLKPATLTHKRTIEILEIYKKEIEPYV